MRELLIATRNRGKFPEMVHGLEGLPFSFKSALDVPVLEGFDVEETGTTFQENAVLKAREYGLRSGLLSIADDSGMEVDALDGAPGVYSARYVPGTDTDRYNAILAKLADVPDERRAARFVSVIAVFDPISGRVETTRGECAGRIVRAPSGENGFGYDPIFFADEIGKTYAEATLEEKHAIDHRGRALKAMREVLQSDFTT